MASRKRPQAANLLAFIAAVATCSILATAKFSWIGFVSASHADYRPLSNAKIKTSQKSAIKSGVRQLSLKKTDDLKKRYSPETRSFKEQPNKSKTAFQSSSPRFLNLKWRCLTWSALTALLSVSSSICENSKAQLKLKVEAQMMNAVPKTQTKTMSDTNNINNMQEQQQYSSLDELLAEHDHFGPESDIWKYGKKYCLVVVHDLVLDVYDWMGKHIGGPSVYSTGHGSGCTENLIDGNASNQMQSPMTVDLSAMDITQKFKLQHGPRSDLLGKVTNGGPWSEFVKVLGELVQVQTGGGDGNNNNGDGNGNQDGNTNSNIWSDYDGPLPSSWDKLLTHLEFDKDAVRKQYFDYYWEQQQIQSQAQTQTSQTYRKKNKYFKTLINIELQGWYDANMAFVNVKAPGTEFDHWCAKRPTISAPYCKRVGNTNKYTNTGWTEKIYTLPDTDGTLAMTNLYWENGLLDLWNSGDLGIVPAVGRTFELDGRVSKSHFDMRDAAAKGGAKMSDTQYLKHGWLSSSIALWNALNFWNVSEGADQWYMLDVTDVGVAWNDIDSTVSDHDPLPFKYFKVANGIPGWASDGIAELAQFIKNYQLDTNVDISEDGQDLSQIGNTSTTMMNPDLEYLVKQEKNQFELLNLQNERLKQYKENAWAKCPNYLKDDRDTIRKWQFYEGGNPGAEQFYGANSDSITNQMLVRSIGLQLRWVAMMLINDIQPRVVQLIFRGFDTHGDQLKSLDHKLPMLWQGISVFVKWWKECGFWEQAGLSDPGNVLITTYSDFGRRFNENGQRGTDHGWGSVQLAVGKGIGNSVNGKRIFANYDEDAPGGKSYWENLATILPYPKRDNWSPEFLALKNKLYLNGDDTQVKVDLLDWNACILQALGLPYPSRMGEGRSCPKGLQLLPAYEKYDQFGNRQIPWFEQDSLYFDRREITKQKYKDMKGQLDSDKNQEGQTNASQTSTLSQEVIDFFESDNGMHLEEPLDKREIQNVARRLGFSERGGGNLGLSGYTHNDGSSLQSTMSRRELQTSTMCKDKKSLSKCKIKKSQGKCSKIYWQNHCSKTCDNCAKLQKKPPPPSPMPPPPPGACQDEPKYKNNCKTRFKKYPKICTKPSNKWYKRCPETCGRCDPAEKPPPLSPSPPPPNPPPPSPPPPSPSPPPPSLTESPSAQPSANPTSSPSAQPSANPTSSPSVQPSASPTSSPSAQPSANPIVNPSAQPSESPTSSPSVQPSANPTSSPSVQPSASPTSSPSVQPSASPTSSPSVQRTANPTVNPSAQPSESPTVSPSAQPSANPTSTPSAQPSANPTSSLSAQPSESPTSSPQVWSPPPEITPDQLSQHYESSTDCWIAVHGLVLDVTLWLRKGGHPGGDVYSHKCGKDMTSTFEGRHCQTEPAKSNCQAELLDRIGRNTDKIFQKGILVSEPPSSPPPTPSSPPPSPSSLTLDQECWRLKCEQCGVRESDGNSNCCLHNAGSWSGLCDALQVWLEGRYTFMEGWMTCNNQYDNMCGSIWQRQEQDLLESGNGNNKNDTSNAIGAPSPSPPTPSPRGEQDEKQTCVPIYYTTRFPFHRECYDEENGFAILNCDGTMVGSIESQQTGPQLSTDSMEACVTGHTDLKESKDSAGQWQCGFNVSCSETLAGLGGNYIIRLTDFYEDGWDCANSYLHIGDQRYNLDDGQSKEIQVGYCPPRSPPFLPPPPSPSSHPTPPSLPPLPKSSRKLVLKSVADRLRNAENPQWSLYKSQAEAQAQQIKARQLWTQRNGNWRRLQEETQYTYEECRRLKCETCGIRAPDGNSNCCRNPGSWKYLCDSLDVWHQGRYTFMEGYLTCNGGYDAQCGEHWAKPDPSPPPSPSPPPPPSPKWDDEQNQMGSAIEVDENNKNMNKQFKKFNLQLPFVHKKIEPRNYDWWIIPRSGPQPQRNSAQDRFADNKPDWFAVEPLDNGQDISRRYFEWDVNNWIRLLKLPYPREDSVEPTSTGRDQVEKRIKNWGLSKFFLKRQFSDGSWGYYDKNVEFPQLTLVSNYTEYGRDSKNQKKQDPVGQQILQQIKDAATVFYYPDTMRNDRWWNNVNERRGYPTESQFLGATSTYFSKDYYKYNHTREMERRKQQQNFKMPLSCQRLQCATCGVTLYNGEDNWNCCHPGGSWNGHCQGGEVGEADEGKWTWIEGWHSCNGGFECSTKYLGYDESQSAKHQVDWYETIYQAINYKEYQDISMEKVVNDWDGAVISSEFTHNNGQFVSFSNECDPKKIFDIDYERKVWRLKAYSWGDWNRCYYQGIFHYDRRAELLNGEKRRHKAFQLKLKRDLQRLCVTQFLQLDQKMDQLDDDSSMKNDNMDFWKGMQERGITDVDTLFVDSKYEVYQMEDQNQVKYSLNQLRARLVWFFLNQYATPFSEVDDWQIMLQQYKTIWHALQPVGTTPISDGQQQEQHSQQPLGNYRTLSQFMYRDMAFRKSLNQLQPVEMEPDYPQYLNRLTEVEAFCSGVDARVPPPPENYAREWLERATVGQLGTENGAGAADELTYNEGDIKWLSWALKGCIGELNPVSKMTHMMNSNSNGNNVGVWQELKLFKNFNHSWFKNSENYEDFETAMVNYVMDYVQPGKTEPAPARYLCHKLFIEFVGDNYAEVEHELQSEKLEELLDETQDEIEKWQIKERFKFNLDQVRDYLVSGCARKMYNKNTGMKDMEMGQQNQGQDSEDQEDNYSISRALEYIIESRPFYHSIGKQRRWPVGVVFGTMMDLKLEKSAEPWTDLLDTQEKKDGKQGSGKYDYEKSPRFFEQLGLLGSQPFEGFVDVEGFRLDRVWNARTLAYAHSFLGKVAFDLYYWEDGIQDEMDRLSNMDQYSHMSDTNGVFFDNRSRFHERFQSLKWPESSAVTHISALVGKKDKGEMSQKEMEDEFYTLATVLCQGYYIPEQGFEGMEKQAAVGIDSLFDDFEHSKDRAESMRVALRNAIQNICSFVS